MSDALGAEAVEEVFRLLAEIDEQADPRTAEAHLEQLVEVDRRVAEQRAAVQRRR